MISDTQKQKVDERLAEDGTLGFWKSIEGNLEKANSPSRLKLFTEIVEYVIIKNEKDHSEKIIKLQLDKNDPFDDLLKEDEDNPPKTSSSTEKPPVEKHDLEPDISPYGISEFEKSWNDIPDSVMPHLSRMTKEKRKQFMKDLNSKYFITSPGACNFIFTYLMGFLGMQYLIQKKFVVWLIYMGTGYGLAVWWVVDLFRMKKVFKERYDNLALSYLDEWKGNNLNQEGMRSAKLDTTITLHKVDKGESSSGCSAFGLFILFLVIGASIMAYRHIQKVKGFSTKYENIIPKSQISYFKVNKRMLDSNKLAKILESRKCEFKNWIGYVDKIEDVSIRTKYYGKVAIDTLEGDGGLSNLLTGGDREVRLAVELSLFDNKGNDRTLKTADPVFDTKAYTEQTLFLNQVIDSKNVANSITLRPSTHIQESSRLYKNFKKYKETKGLDVVKVSGRFLLSHEGNLVKEDDKILIEIYEVTTLELNQ